MSDYRNRIFVKSSMTPAAKPDYAALEKFKAHGGILSRVRERGSTMTIGDEAWLAGFDALEQYERQRDAVLALADEAEAARDKKIRADIALIRPEEIRAIYADAPTAQPEEMKLCE